MSLGEIMVLLIVGIIVIGPKNLPSMMRTAGQWVSKLRRMSTDLRSQSGIDDLIRHEGLEKEIAELRSLARMNVVDSLIRPALGATPADVGHGRSPYNTPSSSASPDVARALQFHAVAPLREREYPLAGCDAHGALDDESADHLAQVTHDADVVPTEAPTELVTSPAGDDALAIDAAPTALTADAATTELAPPAPTASLPVPSPAPAQESAAS
jgi:sec-independent protein translocase protein TatB